MQRIHVIDSHTAGEPTRVVIAGGPPLGTGPMKERMELFRRDYDHFRSAVVDEPRASDAVVGALLCEPCDPACSAGAIFFNNAGFLNMCGHGTIGLAVTLAHLGRIHAGLHRIETPVGIVEAELHHAGDVTLINVPAYRAAANVTVSIPEPGGQTKNVTGDVAWGGNWFFLTDACPMALRIENLEALTDYAWAIRRAINASGYPEVDHIELCGPPVAAGARGRNFVLCPGKAYDRSPCGTGTSARLACLYADGRIAAGEVWRQESLIGTTFDGWVATRPGEPHVIPHIRGSAFVNAEAVLILNESDPFRWGFRNHVGPDLV